MMNPLDEQFDADEVLREPSGTAFDDEISDENEETELDFNDNRSLDDLDAEEMDDPYL